MKSLIITLLLYPITLIGQTTFQRTYSGANEEMGIMIKPTSEGGFIMAGETKSFGAGNRDFYILKTDAEGNKIWDRTIGGGDVDMAYDVIEALEGGYLISGFISGGVSSSITEDICLVKLEESGEFEWAKQYGGGNQDRIEDMVQLADSSILMSGITRSFGVGSEFYLLKTSQHGELVFSKTYGGWSDEAAQDMIITSDNKILLAGVTYSFGGGAAGNGYLVKTDMLGNVIWTKVYGGSNHDVLVSVAETASGNYLLSGYTNSSGSGSSNAWLMEVDTSGQSNWSNTYGDEDSQQIYDAVISDDEGVVLTGTHYDGVDLYLVLIKTDQNGDIDWSRKYLGTSGTAGESIKKVSSGYVVIGEEGFPNRNIYFLQTDLNGNSGCGEEEADILFTQNNFNLNITSGGLVSEGCVVSTPSLTNTSPNLSEDTICFNECNMSLATEIIQSGGAGCDGEINLSVLGGSEPISYQWDANTGNQTTAVATNLCSGEYCVTISDNVGCVVDTCISISLAVEIDESQNDNQITIYPNPSTGQIWIKSNLLSLNDAVNYEITELSGRLVATGRLRERGLIDLSFLDRGYYNISLSKNKDSMLVHDSFILVD